MFLSVSYYKTAVFFANPPSVKKIKLNQFVKVQAISDNPIGS